MSTYNSLGGVATIDSYVANAARTLRYCCEVEAYWQPREPLVNTGVLGC